MYACTYVYVHVYKHTYASRVNDRLQNIFQALMTCKSMLSSNNGAVMLKITNATNASRGSINKISQDNLKIMTKVMTYSR